MSAAAAIGCQTSNLIGLRQSERVQTCSFFNRTFIKSFVSYYSANIGEIERRQERRQERTMSMNLAGIWLEDSLESHSKTKKNGKKGSYYFKVNHLRLFKIQKNIIIFKNKLNHPPTLNIASIDYSPLVQPRLKPSAIRSLIMASCKISYERKRHPLCDSLLKSEVSSCHTEL